MHFAYIENHDNDGAQEMKMMKDPYGRRLRPLMPRPLITNTSCAFFTTPLTHSCSLHSPNLPSWKQPLSVVNDYGAKREISRSGVSSRWNPTPEQLQSLEEMYRRGTRTPSAEQIQQIAAKLRKFGKIEGKNVFYWFQNHKARDRQKKRRQSELLANMDNPDTEIRQPRQSGLSRTSSLEIEHPKKLPTMSNFSTASKYSESMHGAVVQELHKKYSNNEKAAGQENPYPFVALNSYKMLAPRNDCFRELESGIKENQTLELFPIKSSNDLSSVKEESRDGSSIGTCRLVPNQFFEFLPTKN